MSLNINTYTKENILEQLRQHLKKLSQDSGTPLLKVRSSQKVKEIIETVPPDVFLVGIYPYFQKDTSVPEINNTEIRSMLATILDEYKKHWKIQGQSPRLYDWNLWQEWHAKICGSGGTIRYGIKNTRDIKTVSLRP